MNCGGRRWASSVTESIPGPADAYEAVWAVTDTGRRSHAEVLISWTGRYWPALNGDVRRRQGPSIVMAILPGARPTAQGFGTVLGTLVMVCWGGTERPRPASPVGQST